MSAVACKLLRIHADQKDAFRIMLDLQIFGGFEPVEPAFPLAKEVFESREQELVQQIEDYGKAIAVIESFCQEEKKKTVPEQELTTERVEKLLEVEKDVAVDLKKVLSLLSSLDEEEELLQKVVADKENLELLKDVEEPIFGEQELVATRVFVIDDELCDNLEAEADKLELVDYEVIRRFPKEKKRIAVLVFPHNFSDPVDKLLVSYKLETLQSSSLVQTRSPKEGYTTLEALEIKQQDAMETNKKSVRTLGEQHLESFKAMYDLLKWEKEGIDNFRFVGYATGLSHNLQEITKEERDFLHKEMKDGSSLVSGVKEMPQVQIDGWVDSERIGEFKKRLREVGSTIEIEDMEGADPQVRSVFKNNRFFRPFELITNLMGIPHPASEVDPSPFIAPFFIPFFGFALGDGGYGFIMTAAALYFLFVKKPTAMVREATKLILYCGLSTIVFGALTGGWFGADLGAWGNVGTFLKSMQVINIQESLILVLVGSLAIGFFQQIIGLLLSIANYAKRGDLSQGLQVSGSWIVFLIASVVAFLMPQIPALEGLMPQRGNIMMVITFFFLFGQGYGAKFYLRPFVGLKCLLDLTGYLSNTLSYARLLALGLATGVIASVINLIASMAGGIPYVGFIIMILVLLGGHAFNIALNILGTFINVTRLQLVEFFPRFFEAKGIELNPLRVQGKYVGFSAALSAKKFIFR